MERMLSGIKPTGKVTLGNYIGAIKNFIKLQDSYEMYIFIADLHAITEYQDKKELKQNIKDLAALYMACGLDHEKVNLFIQSDVLEHANLGYVLSCNSYMGELNRMTQYKDKVQKNQGENISLTVGFYNYPVLMAADILLYDAKYVPVGVDQVQHLELTRDIAVRFNNRYGDTFVVPEAIIPEVGAKIMSLSNPTKKMSKSDEGDKGCIYLLDDLKVVRKKIMSAVTDSDNLIRYDVENKPGISNLLTIYSSVTGVSIKEAEEKFKDFNYGEFKRSVADAVVGLIGSIQERHKQIIASGVINDIFKEGAQKAQFLAQRKLSKVKKKIGLGI
ncbi:TPA: tryptophan--tRNA ligase [bacterium]|jgi:tryptophanyl-tRNA synthetase|nr:tryptophan--tRNA ligase [bacterium]